MTTKTRQLQAILRQDFFSFIQRVFASVVPGIEFVSGWHIEAIAHELVRAYRVERGRLIITMPPRHLKSIAASVALPAWILGHDPTARIVCVSYSNELAIKHALDTRAVMQSDWYRACFPNTRLDPRRNTQTEVATTRRGGRLATSVGGTLTGRGGNIVIIDDPHKADEALSDTKRESVHEWFQSTLLSRLDSKQTGTIIVIQQRLHEDDLAGRLLARGGGWTHLNLPAIAETDEWIDLGEGRRHQRQVGEPLDATREPLEILATMQIDMGSHAFAAQYQQRPTPRGGGLIKIEWFGRYEKWPVIGEYTRVTQSWDTAFKGSEVNDPSVCLTFVEVENDYSLIDAFRERLEFPGLKRAVVRLAKKYRASRVLIEDAGSGTSLLQELRRESTLNLIARKPETDKIIRAERASALIEAGRISLPEEASWLADFEYEIASFPKGRYDDQVDALSQFVNWRREHLGNGESACMAFPSELDQYDGSLTRSLTSDYDGNLNEA